MKVLFADRIHFGAQRQYSNLMSFLMASNIPYDFNTFGDLGFKKVNGKYDVNSKHLSGIYQKICHYNITQLLELELFDINLFSLIKYELLHHLSTQDSWASAIVPNNDEEIIKKIAKENLSDLILNIAAGYFWVDFWTKVFTSSPNITHFCVFGNSQIYCLAGTNVASQMGVIPIVFEHLFTGNHYYMESRIKPIANYSELSIKNWNPKDGNHGNYLKHIFEGKNRNVSQPQYFPKLAQRNTKTVLFLAQVQNDMSMFANNNYYIGNAGMTAEFVKEFLENTPYNIVVKLHPFERKKVQLETPTTKDVIEQNIDMEYFKERFILLEDCNLLSLIENCDIVVCMHSQAGLEVVHNGKPLVTINNPFYSKQGFTRDFTTITDAVLYIKDGKDDIFLLSPTEKLQYGNYMNHVFNCLVDGNNYSHNFEPFFEKQPAPNLPTQVRTQEDTQAKNVVPARNVIQKNIAQKKQETKPISPITKNTPIKRKYAKLVKNPKLFFGDWYKKMTNKL